MVFNGEFYIARDDAAQKDVIDYFMYEDYKSLLIIDPNLNIFYIKELRNDHNCFVVFLDGNSDPDTESKKIIYIHDKFDEMAIDFVENKGGLLAFF